MHPSVSLVNEKSTQYFKIHKKGFVSDLLVFFLRIFLYWKRNPASKKSRKDNVFLRFYNLKRNLPSNTKYYDLHNKEVLYDVAIVYIDKAV